MTAARIPCLALDVRQALLRPLSELRGFARPDGTPMTPRQARDALADQLAAGVEILAICITVRIISPKE